MKEDGYTFFLRMTIIVVTIRHFLIIFHIFKVLFVIVDYPSLHARGLDIYTRFSKKQKRQKNVGNKGCIGLVRPGLMV